MNTNIEQQILPTSPSSPCNVKNDRALPSNDTEYVQLISGHMLPLLQTPRAPQNHGAEPHKAQNLHTPTHTLSLILSARAHTKITKIAQIRLLQLGGHWMPCLGRESCRNSNGPIVAYA